MPGVINIKFNITIMNANTFLTFCYQIWNLQEDFTALTEFYCFCKTVYFNFFNEGFLNLWFVCNEIGNIQEDGFTSLLMRILKTIFRVSAQRFFFFIDVLFSSTKESQLCDENRLLIFHFGIQFWLACGVGANSICIYFSPCKKIVIVVTWRLLLLNFC